MAWTFVNGAEVATSTNSQTIAKPAGVAVGDALVYVTRTNTNQLAVSTGGVFTEVSQLVSGNLRLQTWFRVVDGSEAATFGFTTGGSATTFFITGIAVRPPTSTPLVDVFSTANNAASVNLCAPSITPTTSDDCLIWSCFMNSTGAGYAPPAGFTTPAGADIISTFRLLMAYDLTAGASATGDLVGAVSGSVANFTSIVALRMLNPPLVGSDTAPIASTEAASLTATVTAPGDTAPIASSTAATLTPTFAASDSGALGTTETATLAATVTGSDTGAIASSATATGTVVFLAATGSDTGAIAATESATVTVVYLAVTGSDTGTIAATESASIGATVAASDAGALLSTESASIAATSVVTDTGALVATEVVAGIALAPTQARPPRVIEVQSTFAAGSTAVVTRGPLTQDGDRLIAHVFSMNPSNVAFSAPAGWVSLTARTSGASFRGQLWSSFAAAGDTSWSFTDTAGSSAFRVTVVTLRDLDHPSLFATTQVSISNSADPDWYAGFYTLPTTPSFTLEFGAATVSGVTFAPVPSAYLPEIAEFTTGLSVVVAGRPNAAPGSTTAELTATPGSAGGIWTIVFRGDPANQDASDYGIVLAPSTETGVVDTGGVEKAGSDSGTLSATENATVTVTTLALTGSDTGALAATETATLTPSVSATDTGAIASTATATVTVVFLALTGSDTGAIASTATASLAATATGADTGALISTDAVTRIGVTTSETAPLGSVETVGRIALTAADSGVLASSTTASQAIVTFKTGTDSTALHAVEIATVRQRLIPILGDGDVTWGADGGLVVWAGNEGAVSWELAQGSVVIAQPPLTTPRVEWSESAGGIVWNEEAA